MGLIHKILGQFHREKLTAEVDEELRYHLAMREDLNRRVGIPPEEARLAAQRSFGNLTPVKESTREADLLVFLETVLKDIHFAARMLAKHPGFTALAVLALAVGIGVNTAVFTSCKAVLLQPLDAKEPGQLVNVYRSNEQNRYDPSFSYPDFEFYRDFNRAFSGLVATTGGELTMTDAQGIANSERPIGGGLAQAFGFRLPSVLGGSSQFVSVAGVSENYFAVLGVNAIRGRVFCPGCSGSGRSSGSCSASTSAPAPRGDPSILGKSVKLNGAPFTIIGITPHDFVGTIINVPNV